MKVLFSFTLLFISFTAFAQYDSTKILQVQNSYGYQWKNGQYLGGLLIPRDTVKMALKDSASIAIKNNILYIWNGAKWLLNSGIGSTPYTLTKNATKDSIILSNGVVRNAVKDSVGGANIYNSSGNQIPVLVTDSIGANTLKFVSHVPANNTYLDFKLSGSDDAVYLKTNSPSTTRIVSENMNDGIAAAAGFVTRNAFYDQMVMQSTSSTFVVGGARKRAGLMHANAPGGLQIASAAPNTGIYFGVGINGRLTLDSGANTATVNGASGNWIFKTGQFDPIDNGSKVQITGKLSVTDTVKLTGKILLADGTQQNGYVLTSNAAGVASWTAPTGGSGTVTNFSKTDNYGITSTVTNPTTTPNHSVAVDSASATGLVSKSRLANTIAALPAPTTYTGTAPITVTGSVISVNDATATTSGAMNAGAQTIGGDKTYLGKINGYTLGSPNFFFPNGNYIQGNGNDISFLTSSNTAAGFKAGSLTISPSFSITPPTNGLYVEGNTILASNGGAFNTTTPGTTNYGLKFSGAGTNNYANGITWNAPGTQDAQAGVYVQSSNAFGTKMFFGTTDSYAAGSKTAMSIDNLGNVTVTRNNLYVANLATGLTPPTTTGLTRMAIFDANGLESTLPLPTGTDTTSLSNRINTKLNITDTANIRLRAIAGTNTTITGTYPNLTFNSTGGGSGWGLTGNAGTDTANNFIGTTDLKPLIIRTNNIERGRVDTAGNLQIIKKIVFNPLVVGAFEISDRLIKYFGNLNLIDANNPTKTLSIADGQILFPSQNTSFVPIINHVNFLRTDTVTALNLNQFDYNRTQNTIIRIPDYAFGGANTKVGSMFISVGKNTNNNVYGTLVLGNNGIVKTGNVLVGGIVEDASSIFNIQSTTQGVLLPRLTTTQINAIAAPANGLTVYNITLNTLCFFNGTAWQKVTSTVM